VTSPPRFGIWAPYRGPWLLRPGEKPDAGYAINRDTIVSADRAGFDTVLIAQHTVNPTNPENEILEAWTAAAAAAAVTSKIEIIAAIKPFLYHPVVLAKMALGIEDISQGRFAINFVNAWFRPELEKSGIGFLEHDERYAYGREWLAIVKALISGERVTVNGPRFKIDDYLLRPVSRHRHRPVIYSGGESGPARDLAADLSDAWFINGQPVAEVETLVRSLRARPRAGSPLRFGLSGFVVARATEGEAREVLDFYLKSQAVMDREKFMKNVDTKAQMFKTGAKYPALIGSNGGVAPGFIGSFDQVAERVLEFHRVGIETFILSFYPLIADQELFAAEVIPRVSHLVAKTH
jgi:alkanesulfonate monooxygenase